MNRENDQMILIKEGQEIVDHEKLINLDDLGTKEVWKIWVQKNCGRFGYKMAFLVILVIGIGMLILNISFSCLLTIDFLKSSTQT